MLPFPVQPDYPTKKLDQQKYAAVTNFSGARIAKVSADPDRLFTVYEGEWCSSRAGYVLHKQYKPIFRNTHACGGESD